MSAIASSASTPVPDYCPPISVIIPIYNGEQDLPGLLKCLIAQTYPKDKVEFLLVDNASCDRTAQILADAAQTFAQQNLSLQVLSETDIQSAYAARNRGIRAAQGEFFAFTDADCYPQPDWLTHLIAPFTDAELGLVAGEIVAFPSTTLLESFAESMEIMSQEHTLSHTFCPYGQTANLAIRREALAAVGLFRPYLTTGGDADICWRVLRETHWQIHYAQNATIQHRHRQTLKDLRSQWYRYGKSNRYLHELHGVELSRIQSKKEHRRSLLRWALKELPAGAAKFALQKAPAIEMMTTPLEIYCAKSRQLGQAEAKLPENARQKAYLDASHLGRITLRTHHT